MKYIDKYGNGWAYTIVWDYNKLEWYVECRFKNVSRPSILGIKRSKNYNKVLCSLKKGAESRELKMV